MPSFHTLEMRWGAAAAYHYLLEVEKAAHIASWKVAECDNETRLKNAFVTQDNQRGPALHLAIVGGTDV